MEFRVALDEFRGEGFDFGLDCSEVLKDSLEDGVVVLVIWFTRVDD